MARIALAVVQAARLLFRSRKLQAGRLHHVSLGERAAEEQRPVGRPFLAVSVGLERPTYIAAAISFSAARLAAVVFQMAVLLAVGREARSQAPAGSGPDQKAAAPTDEQAQTERDKTKEREEILRQMRDRVRAMTVERIDDEAKGSEELMPDPLFRYSDERITVVDATIWGWGPRGRPAALMKVEAYRGGDKGPAWLYCMTSLSNHRMEAHWDDGHEWSSRKPGVQLQPVPGGPAPADSKTATLRQMKELARQFSATLTHPGWGEEKLRPLPRPIHRYADPDSGVEDGAIFVFTCSGTNPAALLVIELHGAADSPRSWHYGWAGMTNAALAVRLDGKEVWKAPYVDRPANLDTWSWFWEDTSKRPQ